MQWSFLVNVCKWATWAKLNSPAEFLVAHSSALCHVGEYLFAATLRRSRGNLQKKPKHGLGGGMFTPFFYHDLHPNYGQDVSGGFFVIEMDCDILRTKKAVAGFESVGVWYLYQIGASAGFQFFNKKRTVDVQQKSQCAVDFLPSWMCMFIWPLL